MAAIRATANAVMAARSIFHPRLLPQAFFRPIWPVTGYKRLCLRAPAGFYAVRCSSTKSGAEEKKPPARLAEVQRLLHEAEERYKAAGGGAVPIPQIKLVEWLQKGFEKSHLGWTAVIDETSAGGFSVVS